MELCPEYCKNIVVGVVRNKTFEWYVTPADLWNMDLVPLYEGHLRWYREQGRSQKRIDHELGDLEKFCSYRFGIKVLDTDTADLFFEKAARYRADTAELKEWFDIEDDKNGVYPTLLVDFDRKVLYSDCPEPLYFEDHVPKGWTGEYRRFSEFIPNDKIYWN